MAERDVKITYRHGDNDDDRRRPRVSASSDGYDYWSDDRYPQGRRTFGENGSTTTTQSVSGSRVPRYVENTYDVDTRSRRAGKESISSDRSTIDSRGRLDRDVPRKTSRKADQDYPSLQGRSRTRLDVSYDRAGRGSREYYVDSSVNRSRDSLRREGNSRVMDTYGQVDIILPSRDREERYEEVIVPRGDRDRRYEETIVPGRDRDRRYEESRGQRYDYEGSTGSGRRYCTEDSNKGERVLPSGEDYIARSNDARELNGRRIYYDTHNTNALSSRREHDLDDDWRIVDSMRDTRLETEPQQQRPRAETQSSEDSYIMVAPSQDTRATVRSAMRRTDYAPAELKRRRSQSVSFCDRDTDSHDVGDRRHEKPGAEAQICGPYLRQKPESEVGSDLSSYSQSRAAPDSRRSRRPGSDYHYRNHRYREPYPAQMDHIPVPRERSRRRRRDREDDDDAASYYSATAEKKYYRSTRYM